MFRLAFWLCVILVVLPANEQQQACLYSVGTSAFERVTALADFGYRLVRDLANKHQDDATTSPPGAGAARKIDQRGTLAQR
jgi:hypothetical protein